MIYCDLSITQPHSPKGYREGEGGIAEGKWGGVGVRASGPLVRGTKGRGGLLSLELGVSLIYIKSLENTMECSRSFHEFP